MGILVGYKDMVPRQVGRPGLGKGVCTRIIKEEELCNALNMDRNDPTPFLNI